MAFIDWIPATWRLRMARGLVKAAALPIVPDWVTASFLEPTWHNLVQEGIKANGAVYGCVLALSIGFIEPPTVVKDADGNPVANHPLAKLLRKPNAIMGESEFASYLMTWWALGGNVYIHKVRNKAGKVIELWPYHAGHISPVPGGGNWITQYNYDKGDGRPIPIPVDDIIHIKWPVPDPDQPWMATPPLLHAAHDVDTDNEATRYLFALLKNDALPRTVLEFPPDRVLDDKQYKRLKLQFTERYGGDKRGIVGILEGGAKVSRVGLNLQELAFDALRRVPEARIAAAFRVPPIVAGMSVGLEQATYANYKEANRQFTEGTLATLWRIAASEMTAGLADEFGGGVNVQYDLSHVRAMQEDESARWTRVNVGVGGGWVTVNEARLYVGMEETPNGDVYLRPAMLVPDAAKHLAAPEERKGIAAIEDKAARRTASQRVGETLLAMRSASSINMEQAVGEYFDALADRVVGRAVNWGKGKRPDGVEAKGLPTVDELLSPKDLEELETLVKRYYADLIHVSWGVWDLALGTQIAFDLRDPVITEILGGAGERIRAIGDTTKEDVRQLLREANERGWSVDHIVRGDPANGVRGLRDIVQETYKNRAKAIARTELGTAQQQASVGRYQRAGVAEVLVLDDGFPNSHETCKWLGGQTRPLSWTLSDHPSEGPAGVKNPLQHPNCVRCFAPYFGD